MKNDSSGADLRRRGFLLAGGVSAAGAVAVAVAPKGAPVAAVVSKPPAGGAGYQESQHVRTYYDLARV